MLYRLERDTAAVPPAQYATAEATLDSDDPSTWGKTTIYNPLVIASIGPDYQFVYASMHHDGHVGEIDLRWDLEHTGGGTISSGGDRFINWQPLNEKGQLGYFAASIPLNLGKSCGRTLVGTGEFKAYWGPLPEMRLGKFIIPTIKWGTTAAGASDTDAEPACPADEEESSDGGTTGGGDAPYVGGTYATEMCLYYDWYLPDGTYWFTEEVSCWVVYTTVNDA